MRFGFKQPLVGEKRCVTTPITAAEETKNYPDFEKLAHIIQYGLQGFVVKKYRRGVNGGQQY